MKKIVLKEIAQESLLFAPQTNQKQREPIHVVYGGANLFTAETPAKLGKIALKSIETYAPNFVEFAYAMWLAGADTLPTFADVIEDLEKQLTKNAEKVKSENFAAWFAWTVYQKTIEKLQREPIEDFRIDFEDGYGFRSDDEEDSHAISTSDALAKSFSENKITPFCGFRIKSFASETKKRAVRTLNLFLENLIEKTDGKLPENFAVTLPKITNCKEIKDLRKHLEKFEAKNKLPKNSIRIEIMIETPSAILDENGANPLRKFIETGKGRITSAHFGAYDYTASFGISAVHQHLNHESCNFARQMMLIALAPLEIRLSDSVTIEMPVPIHKGENLSDKQIRENKRAVHTAWRTHFNNVTRSQINGFYQSWDLHPAQIVARYAAVFAFFLESKDAQTKRLKGFIEKATQASMTGNTFDDAASANGIVNFFKRALNCGALNESEISEATGLSADELQMSSFQKIMENRRNKPLKVLKL